MIAFPAGVRVWIAGGVTDMRRGMNRCPTGYAQHAREERWRCKFRRGSGGICMPARSSAFAGAGATSSNCSGTTAWGCRSTSSGSRRVSSSGRRAPRVLRLRSRRRSSAIFWKVRRDKETVQWTVCPDVKLAQSALDAKACKGGLKATASSSFHRPSRRPVVGCSMPDAASEIALLHAALAVSEARAEAAEIELAQARAVVSTSEVMIRHLRLEIAKLRREQYGHRSERRARLIDQMELHSKNSRRPPPRTRSSPRK